MRKKIRSFVSVLLLGSAVVFGTSGAVNAVVLKASAGNTDVSYDSETIVAEPTPIPLEAKSENADTVNALDEVHKLEDANGEVDYYLQCD